MFQPIDCTLRIVAFTVILGVTDTNVNFVTKL